MADPAPAAEATTPHVVNSAEPGSSTSTVAGAQTATTPDATIPTAVFEAWLVALSPAQLRSVLAMFLVHGSLAELPAAYQQQALGLAPSAAALDASGALEAYAGGVALPLVQLAGIGTFYSAGGEQYRQVPDGATFETLGLIPSAVVAVDTLGLRRAAPWPHGVTPAAAFTAAGAIIAGRGSVGAAYSFAALWLGRIGG